MEHKHRRSAKALARRGFKPTEIAELYGFSKTLIYSEISAGRLPHVRIGGRIIIELDEWNQYLAKRRVTADQAVSRYDATRPNSDAGNSCLTSSGGSNDAKQQR